MNVFAVSEARDLGHGVTTPRTWMLRGRAHADIRVGDVVFFAAVRFVVESIHTYGRATDLLSTMMTGDLVVRLEGDDTEIFLIR